MDWNTVILSLISGSSAGLITIFVKYQFDKSQYKQKIKFQEKKEAFIGLLNSYHQVAVERSRENAMNFAYWQMRCELVTSDPNTISVIENIIKTNDNLEQRNKAHEALKEQLRKDLWNI